MRTPILRALPDAMGGHGIDAHGRDQQRNDGERSEQRTEDAVRPIALREDVVHRSNVEQRQVGIELPQLLADRADDGVAGHSCARGS
jgi:hypothetical protein